MVLSIFESRKFPSGSLALEVVSCPLRKEGRNNMEKLIIRNAGADILQASYFGSKLEGAGVVFVSCNAGCVRLMIPRTHNEIIHDMEAAKLVILTRGVFCGRPGLEILFEDESEDPYVIHVTSDSGMVFPGDPFDRHWDFAVWQWRNGRPQKILSRPTAWRQGTSLPDLRPLGAKNMYRNQSK